MFSHSHGNAETEGKFPTVKYIIDMPSVERFGSDIRYSHSGIADGNNRAKAARGKRIAGCGGFKDAERFRSAMLPTVCFFPGPSRQSCGVQRIGRQPSALAPTYP